jgi:hypothetical protein
LVLCISVTDSIITWIKTNPLLTQCGVTWPGNHGKHDYDYDYDDDDDDNDGNNNTVLHDKRENICLLINISIPDESNINTQETEKPGDWGQ